MWLWSDCWVSRACAQKELGFDRIPSVKRAGEWFIGRRWLNNGGKERANISRRAQTTTIENAFLDGAAITHFNWANNGPNVNAKRAMTVCAAHVHHCK